MATASSVNLVRDRLLRESQVVKEIESALNICVNQRPKSPQTNVQLKGTSGIPAKRYYVGLNLNDE